MMASASSFAGSTSAARAPAALARRRARRPAARRAVPARAASRDSRLPLGVDATFDGTGKTVLITGASSGIGLEAAKQMCAAGCHVLVAARSAGKARAAAEEVSKHAGTRGGGAEPVVIDLGRLAGVRAFAERFRRRGVALDAVVCNAGVAPDRAGNRVVKRGAPRRTHDGFEETIGVNHLGHFALVRDLLPCMTRGGRVVVTSSCVHDPTSPDGRNGAPPTLGDLAGMEQGVCFDMCDGGAFDGNKAYKDSKLCGVLFARALARRVDAAGIVVNAFSPGFVPSSGLFRLQSAPVRAMLKFMFDHPPLATSMENAGRFTTQMVLGRNTGEMTGSYLCGPPSFDVPGEDAHPLGGGFLRGWLRPEFGVKRPGEEALDAALGEKLWVVSERLVEEACAREPKGVSNVVTFAPAPEEERRREREAGKESPASSRLR
jgi:protochlorophyllide reductase